MSNIRLLAVVEVEKTDRVICRAPGCGHSVYKRIHVIRLDDKITVYGSECFKRLCGHETNEQPHYGTATGRKLTDEERQLLIENTESLIAQFEAEIQAATAKKSIPPIENPEPNKPERVENKSSIPPAKPVWQTSIADAWARKQAAREAWRRDKQLAARPIPSPKPPATNEWDNWGAADWANWAENRMAGKATWIDTPKAHAAWKALTNSKIR